MSAPVEVVEAARGRRADPVVAAAIAAVTMALMAATLGDYGMAWDEGFTVEREERLGEWFARVAGRTSPADLAWSPATSFLEPRASFLRRAGASARSLWSRESLRFYWPFAREEPNGHPPFYALLGLAGRAVGRFVLPTLESYRLGPSALFALTVGAVYGWTARSYGRLAGWAAALGLVTMPRVFAHAHLASYDAPTLCLWFLAVAAFSRAAEGRSWAWVLGFGVALGCAMSTKMTGWFLPIPLAAWSAVHRDRRAALNLLAGGLIALVVAVALNPTWWPDPVGGVRVFLDSNLSRARNTLIPTLFFGRLYTYSLPWWNTLVLTAVTVPPATLALALAGVVRVVVGRLRDRPGTLVLGCWAFLIALRALPSAPRHDGERLFLPAFVFLACLAGVGAGAVARGLARLVPPRAASGLAVAVVALGLTAGAWSTWRFHPLGLSYYNALIGGLTGASRAGLEPTYYWDALTPDVRDWLNAHTAPGRAVLFPNRIPVFDYLHHWGRLTPLPNSLPGQGSVPQWYVVQNRAGTLRFFQKTVPSYLMSHARPTFVKAAGPAPGVPLIAVFSIDDASAAEAALAAMGR